MPFPHTQISQTNLDIMVGMKIPHTQARNGITVKPLIYGASNPNTLMCLVSSGSCLCPIYWSQVLSREWRCSWSTDDAPTTSEWPTILLPTNVRIKLGVWRYPSNCQLHLQLSQTIVAIIAWKFNFTARTTENVVANACPNFNNLLLVKV